MGNTISSKYNLISCDQFVQHMPQINVLVKDLTNLHVKRFQLNNPNVWYVVLWFVTDDNEKKCIIEEDNFIKMMNTHLNRKFTVNEYYSYKTILQFVMGKNA